MVDYIIIALLLFVIGHVVYIALKLKSQVLPAVTTNGGSKELLRQVVIKVDASAAIATKVAKELETNLAITREEFRRLVRLLDQLETTVSSGAAASLRTEAQGEAAQAERNVVASDLAEAKIVIAGVAYELKAAQDRAAEVGNEPPGTAADAALTPEKTPKNKA